MAHAHAAVVSGAHTARERILGWLRARPKPVAVRPDALPRERPEAAAAAAPSAATPLPWFALLARVRSATRADCVFAVDGGGILVARDGDYGRVEVERIAAHLSRSFDFLAPLTEIGSSVESVCVMFAEGRWLTALRIRPDESRTVTIGIVGPFTIIRQDRQRIRRSFLRLFFGGVPPSKPDAASE